MAALDVLFREMLSLDGSDLHLLQGQPPKIRLHGHVQVLEGREVLDGPTLEKMLSEVCGPRRWAQYKRTGDADFAYQMGTEARFRGNCYHHTFGHGGVFRVIPTEILSLEQLNAPPILSKIMELTMGLVLVTGPTGSGKSTTLAAMLNHLNENKVLKILTLEDPIEFVHSSKRSIFLQREVHDHTESFSSGLRAALREDCDVILVGEMRDLETISLAISAAENGVLVMGTLHTNSAAKTVDRIVNVFPQGQRAQVLNMLSTSLRAIVSQQLLRKKGGEGRVAVHEILLTNTAARAAIREGAIARLNQVVMQGRKQGMINFDAALRKTVDSGAVGAKDAFLKAFDKRSFLDLFGGKDPFEVT
ncbi:MAG: PilT/PilU family type 4a pilus ATPase [Planctomycetes bacterium]|nr:PilT/PilU family type 4a pilus ATPase [Planctomycetota bacterium]